MNYIKNITVEINGEEYVLWHHEDEYKVADSLHLTKLKDWEKLEKEYPDDMDRYYRFSAFVYSYDEIKESIEEDNEEW